MKDLLDKISIPPKATLWITSCCLILVLANNKIYLAGLQEREKNLKDAELRVEQREAAIAHRELALRFMQLEIRKEINKVPAAKTRP